MESHDGTHNFGIYATGQSSQPQHALTAHDAYAHVQSSSNSVSRGDDRIIVNGTGMPSTSIYAADAFHRGALPSDAQFFSTALDNHDLTFGHALPTPFTFAPIHPSHPAHHVPGPSACSHGLSPSYFSVLADPAVDADQGQESVRSQETGVDFDTMFFEGLRRISPFGIARPLHGPLQEHACPSHVQQEHPLRSTHERQLAHIPAQIPIPEELEGNRRSTSVWRKPPSYTQDSLGVRMIPETSFNGFGVTAFDERLFSPQASGWTPFAGTQPQSPKVSAAAPVVEYAAPADWLPTYAECSAGSSRHVRDSDACTAGESQSYTSIATDTSPSSRPPRCPSSIRRHKSPANDRTLASSSRKRLREEESEDSSEAVSETESPPQARHISPSALLARRYRIRPHRERNYIPRCHVREAEPNEDLSKYHVKLVEAYNKPSYRCGKNGRVGRLDPRIACPVNGCMKNFVCVPGAQRHFRTEIAQEAHEHASGEQRLHTMWLANTVHETARARGLHQSFRLKVLSEPAAAACPHCGWMYSRSDSCGRHARRCQKNPARENGKRREKKDDKGDGGRRRKQKMEHS
ncbi:hypothetical protein K488DRAFT_71513 [Vararia minispora EC-137]|uniref:Uncharacterized protein n=1 Tax=Vararia minispora EC-137 TaxID=1314806 RepID=A0ACB8QHI1_9AGAM|nr:hypothetical protein K488DRAFT_71513 [Vararia minispora EC-137]